MRAVALRSRRRDASNLAWEARIRESQAGQTRPRALRTYVVPCLAQRIRIWLIGQCLAFLWIPWPHLTVEIHIESGLVRLLKASLTVCPEARYGPSSLIHSHGCEVSRPGLGRAVGQIKWSAALFIRLRHRCSPEGLRSFLSGVISSPQKSINASADSTTRLSTNVSTGSYDVHEDSASSNRHTRPLLAPVVTHEQMFGIMLDMSSAMYRSQVDRIRREVADIERKIAGERTRAAKAREDAHRVRRSISSHTSASTLRMKLGQVDRYEGQALDYDKTAARLMTQAANKNRLLADAQTRLERALQLEEKRTHSPWVGTPAPLADQAVVFDRVTAKPLPELVPGFRIVMFTDIQDSTRQAHSQGDAAALATVNTHDTLVRSVVASRQGIEIKHTGDGLMVSFDGLLNALHAAIDIQRAVAEHNQAAPKSELHVRIGLAAGEPLVRGRDLIGAAVQLAARLTDIAPSDGILVPISLRDLARGSGLLFSAAETVTPHGIEDSIQTFVLSWSAEEYEIAEQ